MGRKLRMTLTLSLVLFASVYCHTAAAGDDEDERFSLLSVPAIEVATGEATPEEVAKIRKLIEGLATIDSPDVGLSPTLTGSTFAPIPSSGQFQMGMLTDHQIKTNQAFTKLVELGPKSLPFLLEALGDETPTKLKIEHKIPFGAMWFDHEISGNPTNKHEAKALDGVGAVRKPGGGEHTREYTVRVGDVCFVAIGQITNRPYRAVRYQPTACIVVNSTVKDEKFRNAIRAIWGEEVNSQKLLDSLLIDFHTRGKNSDSLQTGAALRLAYYFPKETNHLLSVRLKKLDVTSADAEKRHAMNGIRAEELVKAVSSTSHPDVAHELLEVFKKSSNIEIILATLPGLGKTHDELVYIKMTELLDKLPAIDPNETGDSSALLIAFGRSFPDRAKDPFTKFLDLATSKRRRIMCYVLRDTCGELAAELLRPLLDDKQKCGWTYRVDPEKDVPQLPARICDEAAQTIAMHSKDIAFELRGEHEFLDRQIDFMRRAIDEGKLRTTK